MSPSPPNFFKPVINVLMNGVDHSLFVAEFSVLSDLRGKADTCQITLEDHDGTRGEVIAKGDLLVIKWGYEGGALM